VAGTLSTMAPAQRYDQFISRAFGTVVLQPTTFCPWACDYCYLPTKDQRLTMPVEVASAVAASVSEQQASDGCVEVVWHGGEPLAVGLTQFVRLLEPFEELRRSGRVRHAVQTGAGLITAGWCELFSDFGFTVGVSIDGPEWADIQRHDRSGRSAHDRIMRGVRTLRAHGIAFSAIAVVTPATVLRADELAEFFENLGCTHVGFNIEECEGANDTRPGVSSEDARAFWRALLRRRAAGSALRVRELDRLFSFVRDSRSHSSPWSKYLYDPIPTVAWNGVTVLLSPELAGIHEPEYSDFALGNVLDETLPAMLARAHRVRYVDEFTRALGACAAGCEFYDFCLGAQAGNRYFEHGTFEATETAYCRNTRQALVRALNDHTKGELK
jgi:uncharacterized protein